MHKRRCQIGHGHRHVESGRGLIWRESIAKSPVESLGGIDYGPGVFPIPEGFVFGGFTVIVDVTVAL